MNERGAATKYGRWLWRNGSGTWRVENGSRRRHCRRINHPRLFDLDLDLNLDLGLDLDLDLNPNPNLSLNLSPLQPQLLRSSLAEAKTDRRWSKDDINLLLQLNEGGPGAWAGRWRWCGQCGAWQCTAGEMRRANEAAGEMVGI